MTNINKQEDVIGKGFSYPFYIDEDTGAVEASSGADNITRSMAHILDVHIGEMPGNRLFGSGIDDLVFSLNDSSNDILFQHFVVDAISTWEPRVSITGVFIDRSGSNVGVLSVGIDFIILQTRGSGSMIYPFYLEK